MTSPIPLRSRTSAEQLRYCADQLLQVTENIETLSLTAFAVAIVLERVADNVAICGNILHDSTCILRPGHGGAGDHIDRDGNTW